ncbi:MAG: type II toxin-antitoxin system Phd/YefM family antitoxin [Pseudomonadales bacterium]|nr:type II toxin-antitoxin system Phd/YefM family antitoxin [Pseudomonadales bacterium]
MTLPSTIAAGKFKASCLQLMDEVALTHQSLVITKHGKPVAKLMPIESPHFELFGAIANSVEYTDADLTQPIDEAWDALTP